MKFVIRVVSPDDKSAAEYVAEMFNDEIISDRLGELSHKHGVSYVAPVNVTELTNDLVSAIVAFREAAYGDSNDAEIEAGQDMACLIENLLATFGVSVPEVKDPWDDES